MTLRQKAIDNLRDNEDFKRLLIARRNGELTKDQFEVARRLMEDFEEARLERESQVIDYRDFVDDEHATHLGAA
jgi:hypothetical protein